MACTLPPPKYRMARGPESGLLLGGGAEGPSARADCRGGARPPVVADLQSGPIARLAMGGRGQSYLVP